MVRVSTGGLLQKQIAASCIFSGKQIRSHVCYSLFDVYNKSILI